MTAIDQSIVDPTNEQVQCDTPLPLCHIFFVLLLTTEQVSHSFPHFLCLSQTLSHSMMPICLCL